MSGSFQDLCHKSLGSPRSLQYPCDSVSAGVPSGAAFARNIRGRLIYQYQAKLGTSMATSARTGANHQTDWTGLVTKLMQQSGELPRHGVMHFQLHIAEA